MHLRMPRIKHALCVYWTILLSLCANLEVVNSNVDSRLDRNSVNQDRLTEVRLIERRLSEQEQYSDQNEIDHLTKFTRDLLKSLASSYNIARKRENSDSTNEQSQADSGHPLFKVLKRHTRQTDSLDKFKNTYTDFRTFLVTFLNLLFQRIKPGSPAVLNGFSKIPDLLLPNDPSFDTRNVNDIMLKFGIITEVTAFIIEKMPVYIKDENKSWFDNDSKMLRYKLNLANFAAASLRLDDMKVISLVSGGIGGVNKGVEYGLNGQTLTAIHNAITVANT